MKCPKCGCEFEMKSVITKKKQSKPKKKKAKGLFEFPKMDFRW